MNLKLFTDTALTIPFIEIPCGTCTISLRSGGVERAIDNGYYFISNGVNRDINITNNAGGSVYVSQDMLQTTNLYSDKLQLASITKTYAGAFSVGSVYVGDSHSNIGGAPLSNNWAAYLSTYNGHDYIAICGVDNTGTVLNCVACFTTNLLGRKAFSRAYEDESHGLNDGDGNSWGGTGTNDRSTDNVGIPPFIGGVTPFNRTGGHGQHVYILDGAAYDAFTGYLWGSTQSVFGDLWQKWENLKFNPIAAVLACHSMPTAFIPLGDDVNTISMAGTAISPMPALTQAVRPENGHIIQYPASGVPSYLDMPALIDFTDFTGVSITVHVPFCGSCNVPASACMGGVGADMEYHAGGIGIVYRCDILTGNVCAFVMCRDRHGNTACVQTLTGNCAYTLPVTGNDNGAGVMLGALTTTAIGAMTGNAGAVLSGIIDAAAAQHHTSIIGNHGGSAAVLTNLYCWAEITYTEYSRPAETDMTRGRPSDIGGTVAESDGVAYQGFTVYDAVDVHGIDCTDTEREMIEQALLQGVYL